MDYFSHAVTVHFPAYIDSFVPQISMVDSLKPRQIMKLLTTVDQKDYRTVPIFDPSDPKSYWVFKNEDFLPWSSTTSSRLLRLSGPSECGLSRVASTVVDREFKATDTSCRVDVQPLVLYFFCVESNVSPKLIARSLLYQIFCSLQPHELHANLTVFLRPLLQEIQRKATIHDRYRKGKRNKDLTKIWPFRRADTASKALQIVLDESSSSDYWKALKAVFGSGYRQLSIIIDRIDRIDFREINAELPATGGAAGDFGSVREFSGCLQMETSKMKVLLTSTLEMGPELGSIEWRGSFIEYDAERKGMISYPPSLGVRRANLRRYNIKNTFQLSTSTIHDTEKY
jgi:hypothetical protein